jgi:hypothetical protein
VTLLPVLCIEIEQCPSAVSSRRPAPGNVPRADPLKKEQLRRK